jgi:hypothetical protein
VGRKQAAAGTANVTLPTCGRAADQTCGLSAQLARGPQDSSRAWTRPVGLSCGGHRRPVKRHEDPCRDRGVARMVPARLARSFLTPRTEQVMATNDLSNDTLSPVSADARRASQQVTDIEERLSQADGLFSFGASSARRAAVSDRSASSRRRSRRSTPCPPCGRRGRHRGGERRW